MNDECMNGRRIDPRLDNPENKRMDEMNEWLNGKMHKKTKRRI